MNKARPPADAPSPSLSLPAPVRDAPAKKNMRYEPLHTQTPRDAARLRDTTLSSEPTHDKTTSTTHHIEEDDDDGNDDTRAQVQGRSPLEGNGRDNDDVLLSRSAVTHSRSVATTISFDDDTFHHQRRATKSDDSTTTTSSTNPTTIPSVQVAVVALSAISGFLFGYDLCVMVVALPLIQEAFELSTEKAEAVVSILMVGAVFGSLAGGVVADQVGRKRAIILTGVFFLLGSICMTFAESISVLLLGRFLAGLAVGSSGPCVSTYIAEIAEPEHRGALVTINEVMVCVGCLVSVMVSSALEASLDGWRKMLGVTLIPPLVQLAGMPFMPESPRWLITQKDRADEAKIVLRRLFPPRDSDETTDIQFKTQLAAKGPTTTSSVLVLLRQVARDQATRKRVVLSLLVALAHTLTGANAMLYYSSYIIDSLHGNRSSSFSGISKELGVAVAKLAGVCTAIVVIDKVGRRPLLLFGSIVMLLADLVFAVCFWNLADGDGGNAPLAVPQQEQTMGIWALYIFIYAWNLSWAPLMLVICSEILPGDLRSVGMGMTFAVYWLGSSLVNQTLLTIFDACGMSAGFLVYGSLTSASIAFVYWKVPETNGLTFEEISELFARTPSSNSNNSSGYVTRDLE